MPIRQELLDELLKEYEKPDDLLGDDGLLEQLTKALVERALAGELTHHLGYEKHAVNGKHSGNSRNGTTAKTIKGKRGQVEIEVPRDRNATFEPQLIKKRETRFDGFDEKIISLYARGMTTREIESHLHEIYGVEVSPGLVSSATEAVLEEVRAWQTRPLEKVYPILYLDALVVKVREQKRVINKAVYLVIGVNLQGLKARSRHLDCRVGRRELLVRNYHGVEKSRSRRYFYRLCGWTQRFSRSDRSGLSENAGATLPCPSGAAFIELCVLQGTQRSRR